jgi:carboxypeptidase T
VCLRIGHLNSPSLFVFCTQPWGYIDKVSPNNVGLRSLATKLASFGGYGLWGPGQPDFLYPVSGDSTDFMYGHHCASSFGFEIGTEFYQSCSTFQDSVVPDMMPALILAAKVASAPYTLSTGPDVLEMTATRGGASSVTVTATVSDSSRATAYNTIDDTGRQNIQSACIYIDVHPYDATQPCVTMTAVDGRFDSTTETVTATVNNLAAGRHTVFIEAKDGAGDKGPVSAVFFTI